MANANNDLKMGTATDMSIKPNLTQKWNHADVVVNMNPTQFIKEQLHRSLTEISSTGSFVTFDPRLAAPDPGLFVKDIGPIGLPLSDQDSHMIIKASLQRFGDDWKRTAAASARRTKELDPEQFELQNPAWQQTLKDIISRVALNVGTITSTIKAEPYKLLLYQRGARFRPQEEHFQSSHVELRSATQCVSEMSSRVFGTLEICLPSKHEGGDLCITRDGQTKVLDTAKLSEFGYSYMAWYATVTHEVKPITSGCRLMLIYSLTHIAPHSPPSAPSFDPANLRLHSVFALWNGGVKKGEETYPKKLTYILDQKYTDENLGFAHLKGSDKLRVNHLEEVCAEVDFCIYLANLERMVCGGCDEDEDDAYGYGSGFGGNAYFGHDKGGKEKDGNRSLHEITDICEETTVLKRVVNLAGSEIATDVRIEECDIAQPDPFANRPDKEDYSESTGNDDVTATHYYYKTAILLMPRAQNTELLFEPVKKGQLDVKSWIDHVILAVQASPSDNHQRDELARLCKLIIEMNRNFLEKSCPGEFIKSTWESENKQYSESVIGRVVTASLLLGRPDLFQQALAAVPQRLSPWVYVNIGKAIHALGFAKIRKELDEAAPRLTRIYERYNALDDILFGYESAEPQGSEHQDLEGWAKEKIQESLNHKTPVFEKDGLALVKIIQKYGDRFLFRRVLPFVKGNASNAAFAMAFATKLFEAGEDGTISKNVVSGIFRDVLSDTIPGLTLGFDAGTSKRQKTDFTQSAPVVYVPPTSPIPLVRIIDGQKIAGLVGQCISLGFDEEVTHILEKLTFESQTAYPSAFKAVLLPFLKQLLNILQRHEIPLSTTRYQHFTQQLIATYLIRYVRAEPRDWLRSCYGCGCDDCNQLDRFLTNLNFGCVSFAMAKPRRDHLESRLPSRGYSVEIVKASLPHTLVITKTEDEGCKSMTRWKQRCEEAEKQILALGTEEQLRTVLEFRYDELLTMRSVKLPTTPAAWAVAPGRRIRYS